jgi:hypothetical protein
MKNIGRVPQIGVRICFISFFALVVSGCVTSGDCASFVDCPGIAVDVAADNDPPGCKHDPGKSKKCNPNAPNKKCPSNIGKGTCTTQILGLVDPTNLSAVRPCSCVCLGG